MYKKLLFFIISFDISILSSYSKISSLSVTIKYKFIKEEKKNNHIGSQIKLMPKRPITTKNVNKI